MQILWVHHTRPTRTTFPGKANKQLFERQTGGDLTTTTLSVSAFHHLSVQCGPHYPNKGKAEFFMSQKIWIFKNGWKRNIIIYKRTRNRNKNSLGKNNFAVLYYRKNYAFKQQLSEWINGKYILCDYYSGEDFVERKALFRNFIVALFREAMHFEIDLKLFCELLYTRETICRKSPVFHDPDID